MKGEVDAGVVTTPPGRGDATRIPRDARVKAAAIRTADEIPESVDEIRTAFEKELIAILRKPAVLRNIEKQLRAAAPRTSQEMLKVVTAFLAERPGRPGPAGKVVLINKIARAGGTEVAQAIAVSSGNG